MRIATWNVNSIRARLERVVAWLEQSSPDVVCLQETKCLDEQFPREPIEDLGYQIAHFGQKTYNGVAILSKRRIEDVVTGFPWDTENADRRAIGAQIDDLLILNLYVVNGQAVGTAKYAYKLEWMARLAAFVQERYDAREKVILCGDFNVAPDDRDVYDPIAWREKILCSTPERDALRRIVDLGYADALRHFTQEPGIYTWWDFRTRGFRRGQGLRIDHFLMSEPALAACSSIAVDVEERARERPSDHAPVVATLG
jgi:exodeoxyribonuclease III